METEQLQRISRALADATRLELLERIAAAEEVACAALAETVCVSQPTVSHHIKELVNAGLIEARREAKFFYYRVNRRVWREYLKEMRRRVPARRRKS